MESLKIYQNFPLLVIIINFSLHFQTSLSRNQKTVRIYKLINKLFHKSWKSLDCICPHRTVLSNSGLSGIRVGRPHSDFIFDSFAVLLKSVAATTSPVARLKILPSSSMCQYWCDLPMNESSQRFFSCFQLKMILLPSVTFPSFFSYRDYTLEYVPFG